MGPWLRAWGCVLVKTVVYFFSFVWKYFDFFFSNAIEAIEKVDYSFNLGHHVDN